MAGQVDFVHEAFQKVVNETPVVTVFFLAMSGFAALLICIEVLRNYAEIVLKNKISPMEMARPFFLLLVICSWRWIYMGLNMGFDSINYFFTEYLVNRLNKTDVSVLDTIFAEMGNDTSFSITELSMATMVIAASNYLVGGIHWLMDTVVSLYLDVNDFVLALLAPVAIVFSVLKETSASFITWLKLFIKFRIYMIAISIIDFLAILLVKYVKAEMAVALEIPQSVLSIVGVNGMVNTLLLSVFIIVKILFLVMVYKFVTVIIHSGDLGAGDASAGVMKKLHMITQKIATKGAK